MMPPTEKYPWRFGLFIGACCAANAVYQGYMSKYYQAVGMEGTYMMVLLAAAPAVAIVAQPIWGRIGDRMKTRNAALTAMLIASLAAMLLMRLNSSFAWLLSFTCIHATFYTPIQPMGDSIVLESLEKQRAPFGPVRLFGSYAFALTNLVAGRLFESGSHIVPYVNAVLLVVLLAASRVLPKTRGHQHGKRKVPLRDVLRLPYMVPLMLLVIALQLSMGYFYSYFTLHFTSLPGGTSTLAGLAFFISAISETPFLILSDRLFIKYGTGKLMVASALLLTVRLAILGLSQNIALLLVNQVLHGGGFVVITVTMAKYINRVVPDELKASGQMLLAVVGYGLARVFGTLCGGYIQQLTGGTAGGFLAMAGLSFLAFCLSAAYFLPKPPINGEKPLPVRSN